MIIITAALRKTRGRKKKQKEKRGRRKRTARMHNYACMHVCLCVCVCVHGIWTSWSQKPVTTEHKKKTTSAAPYSTSIVWNDIRVSLSNLFMPQTY